MEIFKLTLLSIEHDEKILRNRYKKEMGALKNDKTAYFLERAASNDLDMIKYLVESKQMKTTSTLKSVPKKNPMNLKKGESLTDVLKRSDSKEVCFGFSSYFLSFFGFLSINVKIISYFILFLTIFL